MVDILDERFHMLLVVQVQYVINDLLHLLLV